MKKALVLTLALILAVFSVFTLASCDVDFNLEDIFGSTNVEISFVVDGVEYATVSVENELEEIIILPENPTKDGYNFEGWYWDEGTWEKPFTANSLLDAPIQQSISVYAKWSPVTPSSPDDKTQDDNNGGDTTHDDTTRGGGSTEDDATGGNGSGGASNPDIHTHSMTHHTRVEASCTTDGNIEYWYCSECEKMFFDANANTEITAVIIGREGHDLTHHARVEPKCTADGNVEYWSCSKCENNYSGEEAINELDVIVINGTGHSYSDGVCTKCGTLETTGLVLSISDDYYYVSDYTGNDSTVIIPSEYNGKKVTSISSSAFRDCNVLTSITISNNILFIGDHAFYSCDSLASVTIGTGVISIGEDAFSNCVMLESITIPNNVTSINKNAFRNCSSLTSATFAEDSALTFIGSYAFSGCTSFESITVPNSVTSISNYAFSGCSSLTSVTIGNGVKYVGSYAFSGCHKLVEVYNFSSLNIAKGDSANGYVGYYALNVYTSASSESKLHTTTDGYIFYEDGDTVYLVGYTGNSTTLTLPDNYNGKNYAIYEYAFYENGNITSVTIPSSVATIGDYSFSSCASLESVIVPNSIISIGSSTFKNCTSLTSITIPNSVTSIGSSAFDYCTSLTYNEYDNAYYLGNNENPYLVLVKAKNTSIMTCTINSNARFIYKSAFSSCTSLESVTIPDSITTIGSSAFYNCASLDNVYISDIAKWCAINFADFSSNPLYYANNLCSTGSDMPIINLIIPDGVTSIGSYAFRGCTLVESITIPNSVTSIDEYAFYNCTSLKSITIPSDVTFIGNYAFYNCTSLTEIKFNATAMNDLSSNNYVFTCAEQSANFIKVTIGKNVTKIPAHLFDNYANGNSYAPNISIVVFEDGGICTSIGDCAFRNCSSLAFVITIPNSIASIGDGAFHNCSSLTSMTIPSDVTSIGEWAFLNCTSLDKVYISDVTKWCSINFADFSSNPLGSGGKLYIVGNDTPIANLVIPDSVTSISNYSFYNCFSLTSVTIGSSVTSIGAEAFEGCSALKSVTFAKGSEVASIGEAAFYNCTSLTSITIPNSVTSIGEAAFYNCTSLTSITIPNSVTSIGSSAFRDCTSLTGITIPNSVTSIGRLAFLNCTSLAYNEYDNAYYLGNNENPYLVLVKAKDTSIMTCTINSNTRFIYWSAFSGCASLTSITIPNSVIAIGYWAFNNCTSLDKVYISDIAKWCTISFDSSYSNPLYYAKKLYMAGSNTPITNLVIPEAVTTIPDYAFSSDAIVSVTIPSSVMTIGELAFLNCTSLKTVTFAENSKLNSIGGSAFNGCSSLKSITIPSGVTAIGDYTFYKCASLISATFAEDSKIATIGTYAFGYCNSLESITIPSDVTSISEWAFYNCTSLDKVYISNIAKWCSISFGNEQSTPLYWAEKLYMTGSDTPITNLVIPEGVTTIPNYAFSSDAIVSVTIQNSATSIGSYAFNKCTSLTSVTFENKNGWWVSTSSSATSGTSISSTDLESASTAATYLKSTYYYYYWKRG